MLLAGFAHKEFTPEKGNMAGQMYITPADGKFTPLLANASAFTCGEDSIIMLSLDLAGVRKYFSDPIRERISAATGVPVSNIMVAATHTHTSCVLDTPCWYTPAEPENLVRVIEAAIEAALAAWQSREAARLGIGLTYETRFSFIRDIYLKDGNVRTNPWWKLELPIACPTAAIDHSVNVMRVEDTAGKVKAFIVNYANHPDNHHSKLESNDKYSADYPGYLRTRLLEEYGEDVEVLFFNGTCGDVNADDFMHGTSKKRHYESPNPAKEIGEGLADTVLALQPSIFVDVDNPVISAIDRMHKLPRRFKTQEQYEWALSLKDKIGKGEIDEYDELYAMEYLRPDEDFEPEFDFEIQTFQLGPWAIVGLTSEIYTQIGLKIKAKSPFANTVVFELVNDTHGYVPTDKIIGTNSYPARLHSKNSYAGKGSADIIASGAAEQLEELFERAAQKEFIK